MVKSNSMIVRLFRKLFFSDLLVKSVFHKKRLSKIKQAIVKSELGHSGQVMFVIEDTLPIKYILKNQSPRDRSEDLFQQLGISKTEKNNGILIYILFSEKSIEILADSGISSRIEPLFWQGLCKILVKKFQTGSYEEGVLQAISEVDKVLCQLFPKASKSANELPDKPIIL